ncbi:MAG TPA: flavin prenyltransferase UbiX [Longimicrobium sp.]|nr:flavin prenyltransferase UbiX [Longimicrobium sp.]
MRRAEGAPVTFGITGASGAPYAVRLLRALVETATPVRLIVSGYGLRLLAEETGIDGIDALKAATGDWRQVELYDALDRGATPASGSAPSRGMVVCPCSMGTLASIAAGTSRNLVERAADVALKERRPLVLVPRETPLSLVHLENMTRLTRAGATILPAAPGFYHRPRSIDDLVDFVVARILDHLEVEHSVGRRWKSGERQGTGNRVQGTTPEPPGTAEGEEGTAPGSAR